MILEGKFGEGSPDAYECKLAGSKAGHVLIDEAGLRVAWVPLTSKTPEHVWDIADIVELQKVGRAAYLADA